MGIPPCFADIFFKGTQLRGLVLFPFKKIKSQFVSLLTIQAHLDLTHHVEWIFSNQSITQDAEHRV